MAVIRDQGKTTFTREVLKKNPQANVKAVNDAWKDAGHEGSISDTLVNKVRSDMKLTGNIRPGRRPVGSNGAVPKAKGSKVVKRTVVPTPKADGKHPALPTVSAAKPKNVPAARAALFTALEHRIDDMIFEVRSAGGLAEFEDALRKARRILARSHEE